MELGFAGPHITFPDKVHYEAGHLCLLTTGPNPMLGQGKNEMPRPEYMTREAHSWGRRFSHTL